MEYLIGSVTTLAICLSVYYFAVKAKKEVSTIRLFRTQSTFYELLGPVFAISSFFYDNQSMPETQATRYVEKNTTKVLFTESKAYWISNNCFYQADIIDGEVDQNEATPVDIMALDDVQLKEMSFIVEKLTEGSNNEGNGTGF